MIMFLIIILLNSTLLFLSPESWQILQKDYKTFVFLLFSIIISIRLILLNYFCLVTPNKVKKLHYIFQFCAMSHSHCIFIELLLDLGITLLILELMLVTNRNFALK